MHRAPCRNAPAPRGHGHGQSHPLGTGQGWSPAASNWAGLGDTGLGAQVGLLGDIRADRCWRWPWAARKGVLPIRVPRAASPCPSLPCSELSGALSLPPHQVTVLGFPTFTSSSDCSVWKVEAPLRKAESPGEQHSLAPSRSAPSPEKIRGVSIGPAEHTRVPV